MSMPFYVAPEQVMKDRADYARKGIARGRSLAALSYNEGILICAENSSNTLRKVSEIYDRIAFAGVGKYNEFDQLRIAGVRHAQAFNRTGQNIQRFQQRNAANRDANVAASARPCVEAAREPTMATLGQWRSSRSPDAYRRGTRAPSRTDVASTVVRDGGA